MEFNLVDFLNYKIAIEQGWVGHICLFPACQIKTFKANEGTPRDLENTFFFKTVDVEEILFLGFFLLHCWHAW